MEPNALNFLIGFEHSFLTSSHVTDTTEQRILLQTALVLAEGVYIQEHTTILYKSTPGRRCYSPRKRKKIEIGVYKYSQEIPAHMPPNI